MSEKGARTIAIRSIGCRTNQEEMVVLSGKLASQGYSIVDDLSSAAIIIVNTCSVTALPSRRQSVFYMLFQRRRRRPVFLLPAVWHSSFRMNLHDSGELTGSLVTVKKSG
jgi:hypothetical protein